MNIFAQNAALCSQHNLTSEASLYTNLSACLNEHGKEVTKNAINATIDNLAECEVWQRLFFLAALSKLN